MFIPDDPLEWPSCNNRKFKVWLIPTAPIARVYQEICDRTFKSKYTLNTYWWPEKHPLFNKIYNEYFSDSTKDKLLDKTSSGNTLDNQFISEPIIDVDKYHKIRWPKLQTVRYSCLHGKAMTLIERVKNDKVLYKKTMVQLTALLEDANCEINDKRTCQDTENFQVKRPLPPNVSRNTTNGRQTAANNRNVSNYLKNLNSHKRTTCQLCLLRNPLNANGHRQDGACPFKKSFCDVCLDLKVVDNTHESSNCPRK